MPPGVYSDCLCVRPLVRLTKKGWNQHHLLDDIDTHVYVTCDHSSSTHITAPQFSLDIDLILDIGGYTCAISWLTK